MPNPGTAFSAGASVLGGSLASSGASSAAATQAAAADRAAQLQKEMFEKQIGLQEPFRQAGMAGQNRLMELLGLRMPAQAGVGGAPAMRSEADLRNAMLGQYTTPERTIYGGSSVGGDSESTVGGEVNEAGLAAAIRNAQAQDQAALTAYQAQQAQAAPSADFGKYARDFGMSDFQADPGYAFRLAEGQKALERTAAARGGLLSGAALKAATRYGQEAGSQEFTNAFNRYQTNRANQLNPLQSLANQAQTSANTIGSAAGQYGVNAGNLIGQGGQAIAAGQLGVGNTWNNALGTMASSYQNQQNFNNWLNQNSYQPSYESNMGVNFLSPNTYG